MRIDAHQHFWEPDRHHYAWMPPEPSRLRRTYLPEDLRYYLARNRFDGSIAVQAATEDGETDWLLDLADAHDFILGVVGWVDLTDPDVAHRLDALCARPKFCGVRHPADQENEAEWLLRPDVLRGLREVVARNLPFDLLVRTEHLHTVERLADAVPDLRLMLDHIGKPRIAAGEFDRWAPALERVAQIPQLHAKISGLVTEADWKTWFPKDLAPYVQHAWRCFGPERCVFGSDWPVCLQAGTWKEALAGFTQALGPVDKNVRAGVIGENAARFYRLRVPTTAHVS